MTMYPNYAQKLCSPPASFMQDPFVKPFIQTLTTSLNMENDVKLNQIVVNVYYTGHHLKQTKRVTKRCKFVSEVMDGKGVEECPGLAKVRGEYLRRRGYFTARQIYDKFLELGIEIGRFYNWLNGICGADKGQAERCFNALLEWHVRHVIINPVYFNGNPMKNGVQQLCIQGPGAIAAA